MSNVRFSGRNVTALAVLSASPSLVSTLPPAALQRLDRWDMARSTFVPGLDSPTIPQYLYAAWPTAQRVSMVMLRMHNFSTTAQIRIRHFSDAARTAQVYDSGFIAAFSTSGLNTQLDVHTDYDFRLYKNFVHYHSLLTNVRSTEITIVDGANPDGYVEASYLLISEYIEVGTNPAFGAVMMKPGDNSRQAAAEDGTLRSDKSFKSRELTIRLEVILDDYLPTAFALLRYQGLDKPFFVDCFPEVDTAQGTYSRALMKFTSINALDPYTYGIHRNDMPMKEC